MVDNAKAWAEKNGLVRKNEVHGVDEFRVPTKWDFNHASIERSVNTASSSAVLEAGPSVVTVHVDVDVDDVDGTCIGSHLMGIPWNQFLLAGWTCTACG